MNDRRDATIAPPIDLDAYFERIGYTGERTPTLATLRAIHARHPQAIAFENLDPLLGRPVPLDARSLEQKLIRNGRGGYCFEQNLLFSHVLESIGFHVTGLKARVLWNSGNASEYENPPRSHMLMRVDLDGQVYIADVGFGGQTLTGPLRLEPDIEQVTPHEPFRFVKVGDDFVLQSKIRSGWTALYLFDLQEQFLADYEVSNYYVSTHPSSLFTQTLFIARPDVDRRYTLFGSELKVHHLNGRTERRVIESVAELREALAGAFRLTLRETPELDAVLARVIQRDRAVEKPFDPGRRQCGTEITKPAFKSVGIAGGLTGLAPV